MIQALTYKGGIVSGKWMIGECGRATPRFKNGTEGPSPRPQSALNATRQEDEEAVERLIGLLQEQDDAIEAYAVSLGDYDNSTLIANIGHYCKQTGPRIGNIERFLGLSAGYISRTAKESGKKRMSIPAANARTSCNGGPGVCYVTQMI